MTGHDIRPATKDDVPELLVMVQELLEYLGDPTETFDPEKFVEDGFGDDPQFNVAVVTREPGSSQLAGYVLYHDAYEPSHAARGVYLVDLYVRPEFRRRRLGRALMAEVAKEAVSRKRYFLWWIARGRSADAREFYRTLTGIQEEATMHALAFDGFEQLAREAGE